MIQLVFFLFVGALLLSSLFLLGRRGSRAEGNSQVLVEARQALNTLQGGLLPRDLVTRIFAKDDFEYVDSIGCKPVHELFAVERRKIALSWVNQVRAQVLTLRRFHLGAARFYSRLGLRREIGVAWQFANLLLACRALQVLFYLGGPYAAPRVVGTTAAVAARLCAASEKSLAFLNPVQVVPLRNGSAGTLGM
ncbi:MAG: hypothetical protein ABSE45_01640 [Candidatus Acidiferrales bacterium]